MNNYTRICGMVMLLTVLLSGCYFAPATPEGSVIQIDLTSQGIVGDSGDGYYIRAKLYDAASIRTVLDGGDLIVDTQQFLIQYDPLTLPSTVSHNVFYLGTNYPYSGVVVMADLPAERSYRIILEELFYSSQFGTSPDAIDSALLTAVFEVPSGESIVIDGGELLSYSPLLQ